MDIFQDRVLPWLIVVFCGLYLWYIQYYWKANGLFRRAVLASLPIPLWQLVVYGGLITGLFTLHEVSHLIRWMNVGVLGYLLFILHYIHKRESL